MHKIQEMWGQSLSRKDPLEQKMAAHSRILARKKKSHGQRSLVGYSPRDRKESDTTDHACMRAKAQ